MKYILLVIAICLSNIVLAASPNCQTIDAPAVKKHMENWDIIATNVATIPTAPIFSGKNLTFQFSAKPKNNKNRITINKKTGIVKIKAERKDNFDMTIIAKNRCGKISDTFNVIIDEEE